MGIWGMTPGQSVAAECGRRGTAAVVAGCVDLLEGGAGDEELLLALGGPPAELVIAGRAGGRDGYWPRVWAARGLLYAWDERASPAVLAATGDEAWRVREMALKVIRRRRIGDGLEAAAGARTDPVSRVRAAAERALVELTRAGA